MSKTRLPKTEYLSRARAILDNPGLNGATKKARLAEFGKHFEPEDAAPTSQRLALPSDQHGTTIEIIDEAAMQARMPNALATKGSGALWGEAPEPIEIQTGGFIGNKIIRPGKIGVIIQLGKPAKLVAEGVALSLWGWRQILELDTYPTILPISAASYSRERRLDVSISVNFILRLKADQALNVVREVGQDVNNIYPLVTAAIRNDLRNVLSSMTEEQLLEPEFRPTLGLYLGRALQKFYFLDLLGLEIDAPKLSDMYWKLARMPVETEIARKTVEYEAFVKAMMTDAAITDRVLGLERIQHGEVWASAVTQASQLLANALVSIVSGIVQPKASPSTSSGQSGQGQTTANAPATQSPATPNNSTSGASSATDFSDAELVWTNGNGPSGTGSGSTTAHTEVKTDAPDQGIGTDSIPPQIDGSGSSSSTQDQDGEGQPSSKKRVKKKPSSLKPGRNVETKSRKQRKK